MPIFHDDGAQVRSACLTVPIAAVPHVVPLARLLRFIKNFDKNQPVEHWLVLLLIVEKQQNNLHQLVGRYLALQVWLLPKLPVWPWGGL